MAMLARLPCEHEDVAALVEKHASRLLKKSVARRR
jgi:hypothetical protein